MLRNGSEVCFLVALLGSAGVAVAGPTSVTDAGGLEADRSSSVLRVDRLSGYASLKLSSPEGRVGLTSFGVAGLGGFSVGLDTTSESNFEDLGLDFSDLASVVTTTRSVTARESDMSFAQWSSTPFASSDSYSTDQTLPFTPVPLPVPAALAFTGLGWVAMRRSR